MKVLGLNSTIMCYAAIHVNKLILLVSGSGLACFGIMAIFM